MSSDSELSDELPDDAVLEDALRDAVAEIRSLDTDLTVNTARTAAEKRLRLPAGFYKSTLEWKEKSKNVINAAATADEEHPKLASPTKPVKKKPATASAKRGTKRALTDNPTKGKKRQKKVVSEDESEALSAPEVGPSDDDEEEGYRPPGKKVGKKPSPAAKRQKGRPVITPTEAEYEKPDKAPAVAEKASTDSPPLSHVPDTKGDAASSSDLSDVIDEPPPKKRQQKDNTASKGKTTAPRTSGTSAKAPSTSKDADQNVDDAEIKRLQGWLIKCGIRKVWGKELKPFESPKAKIKHLKEMLKDAGMEGRYSVDKARQIKEQRELAADLEAVKEGNEKWGQEAESEDEEKQEVEAARPKRRSVVERFVDFGDDDEDSD